MEIPPRLPWGQFRHARYSSRFSILSPNPPRLVIVQLSNDSNSAIPHAWRSSSFRLSRIPQSPTLGDRPAFDCLEFRNPPRLPWGQLGWASNTTAPRFPESTTLAVVIFRFVNLLSRSEPNDHHGKRGGLWISHQAPVLDTKPN